MRATGLGLGAVAVMAGVLVASAGSGVSAQEFEVVGYGHVEVTEDGYAITFPSDWVAVRLDEASHLSQKRRLLGELTGRVEEAREVEFMYIESIQALGRIPGGDGDIETCNINLEIIPDLTEGERRAAALSVETFEPVLDAITIVGQPEMLSLPVGDVARISYDIEFDGIVLENSLYVYDDGEVFVNLTCGGSDRPGDAWLSIAETFEFLPAE